VCDVDPGPIAQRGAALRARAAPARKIRAMSQAPSAVSTLRLTVNGEATECRPGATVADLLATMDTAGKRIAVERNGEIVPRSQHATTALGPGDRLEIVIAVGGG
jgi:sulfur carrier protein